MRYSSECLAAHTQRYRQGAHVLIKSLLCLLVVAPPVLGQTAAPSSTNGVPTRTTLPDNPQPDLESSDGSTAFGGIANSSDTNVGTAPTINGDSPSAYGHQTKRILYIVPNFHSVSAGSQLPPQSAKGKLLNATQDSFDYSGFIFVGMIAGVGQAQRSTPEFGQGSVGYGRYYWHVFADQTDENYLVEGFMPIIFRQDTRYYTLGRGGLLARSLYAFESRRNNAH